MNSFRAITTNVVENVVSRTSALFFITLATSIILEAWVWSSYRYNYSFVSTPEWWGKHIFIALALTLFLFLLNRSTKPIPILALGVLLPTLAIGLTFASQYGYNGTWFCGYTCEDIAPLGIPFAFGFVFLSALTEIGILSYVARRPTALLLTLLIIVSLFVIGYSLWRPIYQKQILEKFPFYTDRIVSQSVIGLNENDEKLTSYIESNKHLSQTISIKEWESACVNFKWSSLGLGLYGALAVNNCYSQGALLYDDANLCNNVQFGGAQCRNVLIELLHKVTK